MEKLAFRSNPEPTLGVELELALVEEGSMALASAINDVLARVPPEYAGSVKPELMQCYLEINTAVCQTVAQAEADLREKLAVVEGITDELGLRLYWTATHPFSPWEEQLATPNERYARLLEMLQDMGQQLVTFGLHVHVAVDSGDKAVMICDRIMRHLPTLLALSCNSPWWNGRVSGLQSHRSKIMDDLPTAGLPPLMRNWSEYVWLLNHLVETGFVSSPREIWWDVRPHYKYGTVEVRICDMPASLDEVLAIAALVQCLVTRLSEKIDEGMYQHDCHPMMVRQNKWAATRYGLEAHLVDTYTHQRHPARYIVEQLVAKLRTTARQLDCEAHLDRILEMAAGPTGADRQLALLRETGDMRHAVDRATRLSRLTARTAV